MRGTLRNGGPGTRSGPGRARWWAPVLAGALGLPLLGVGQGLWAAAPPRLPAAAPGQLVTDVLSSRPAGLAGTVHLTTNLGFPALPPGDLGNGLLGVLAGGTTTVRIWQDPGGQLRLELPGPDTESDAYLSAGRLSTWSWGSRSVPSGNVVVARGHPAAPGGGVGALLASPFASLLPAELARSLVLAAAPTTTFTTAAAVRVAGRAAYQLRLVPRQAGTLVRSVTIAVDAATGLPLAVDIDARAATAPALILTFTSLALGTQPRSVFSFTPPPGTHQVPLGGLLSGVFPGAAGTALHTRGHGWDRILVLGGPAPAGQGRRPAAAAGNPLRGLPIGLLRPFHGGRLLATTLFTLWVAPDHRVYVGAVTPAELYRLALG